MGQLLPNLKQRFLDANGDPLEGGKLFAYRAGTSTLLATYTDQSEATPNLNPVILDANGEADVWISNQAYKFVLADADDQVLWTVDNVSYMPAGYITAAMLADGSVTTPKLADGALANSTEGRAKMADNFLSADAEGRAKMAAGYLSADSTGRGKMADGYVTKAKMAAFGEILSVEASTPSEAGTTYADITGMTLEITTTGRPVFVGLVGTSEAAKISIANTSGGTSAAGIIKAVRDSTDVGFANFAILSASIVTSEVANGAVTGTVTTGTGVPGNISGTLTSTDVDSTVVPLQIASTVPPSSFWCLDSPAAGTYTYKLQWKMLAGGGQISMDDCKLIAFEMG